jgi:hypothetical protein
MHGTIITILQLCKAWHPIEVNAIHAPHTPAGPWFTIKQKPAQATLRLKIDTRCSITMGCIFSKNKASLFKQERSPPFLKKKHFIQSTSITNHPISGTYGNIFIKNSR